MCNCDEQASGALEAAVFESSPLGLGRSSATRPCTSVGPIDGRLSKDEPRSSHGPLIGNGDIVGDRAMSGAIPDLRGCRVVESLVRGVQWGSPYSKTHPFQDVALHLGTPTPTRTPVAEVSVVLSVFACFGYLGAEHLYWLPLPGFLTYVLVLLFWCLGMDHCLQFSITACMTVGDILAWGYWRNRGRPWNMLVNHGKSIR